MQRPPIRLDVCGATRLLVPAGAAALVASTLSGSDAWGWAAAIVVALALAIAQRSTGRIPTCAVTPPPARSREIGEPPPGDHAPSEPTIGVPRR